MSDTTTPDSETTPPPKAKKRKIGRVTRRPKNLNTGGRPTILTPTLIECIAAKVAEGVSLGTAAVMFSVSRSTVNAWYTRGYDRDDESLECRFARAIEKARGKCVGELVSDVREAGRKGQWQASKFLLSTLEPETYSDVKRIEHSGEIHTKNVSLNLSAALGNAQAVGLAGLLKAIIGPGLPAPAVEAESNG